MAEQHLEDSFIGLQDNQLFGLLMHLIGPIVAYFLIIERGVVFDTANILVILLSLKEMQKLSTKLLDDFIKMGRACNVLRDVSELVNAREITDELSDMEKGCLGKKKRLSWMQKR